jgi:aryl-alcohol dehydrogenase-like predicted oxidoreductase
MKYRRLGRSGLQVSTLVLGTMNFGRPTEKAEAFRIVDAALDAGINLIDCADVYNDGQAEDILGEALRRDAKRSRVLLTSKVFNRTGPGPNDLGNTRHHIVESCEKSLRKLQTDHIDIYFLHRTDFNVPQEETLAALDFLVSQGKIRYVAGSTFPAWRTVEALLLAERYGYPKLVCEQPPYNLLDRRIENEILPMCRAYDMGVLAWSPLAHGVLAGRYADAAALPDGSRGTLRDVFRQRITDRGIDVGQRFVQKAESAGCSAAQLAVAWVLHQPGVTAALIGPRNPAQLESLLPAAEIRLDEPLLQFCDQLVPPGSFVVNYFNTTDWMRQAV